MKKYTYKAFIINMFLCAGLFMSIIWGGKPPNEVVPQLMATTFTIGLASFLLWITSVFWDIRNSLQK